MNNATEQMLGSTLNPKQQMFAAMAALRNAWFARPGDIIVSSRPLGDDFEEHICRTLGIPAGCFEVVGPDQTTADLTTVSDDLLLSGPMVDALQSRVGRTPVDWSMMPCYQTEGVAQLGALLGLTDSVGRRFAEQRGTDLFNRKSHFRQLATATLPLADGSLVTTPGALAQAIHRYIGATGMVIVKRDNGAGGTGNVVVTTERKGPQPGAFETVVLDSSLPELADSLWSKLATESNNVLVVEAYYTAVHMFYIEFHIGDDGSIDLLNTGTIRLRLQDDPGVKHLFWIGLELPADLASKTRTQAVTISRRFARLAAKMGYRGHINIDAIVSADGKLIFNEANARWGGGTVLQSVAEHLLGPQYAHTHVVSSFRDVPAPNLMQALNTLQKRDLVFNAARSEGIVLLACGHPLSHSIEALVMARTRPRLRELESQLLQAMADATGEAK
jgi:hypothetical protein